MLGSSIIIMVALNSYIFLGRRYNSIQYAGMFIVLASLLIVCYAADMAARDKNQGVHEASASEQAFGMFLCRVSSLLPKDPSDCNLPHSWVTSPKNANVEV